MAFNLSEVLKDVSVPDTRRERFAYLPYATLIPDPNNGYSMDGLDELARSIELVGLQQPLRVKELGADSYGLISGHRRHAAIGRILKRNPHAFADGIPCIIDAAGGSPAMRELQLLLANADNRKMTPADELQQAERISDCLRRLEEEGYTFPGRHRDWVSKMSGMSKSKLARLDAIKKHLSATWIKFFNAGKLTETVAYAMQQIPERYQELLYTLCVGASPRVSPGALTEYTVKGFAESVANAERRVCSVDGSGEPCIWKEQLITAGNQRPGWPVNYGRCSFSNRCSSCCSTCDRLAVCETVCPKMLEKAKDAAEKKQAKDAALKLKQDAEREQSRQIYEERRRKEQEILDGIWHRMGTRRREIGLSVKAAYLHDEFDEDDINDIERLESEGGADEDPFSCLDLYEPVDLCSLADRLQCSLDYLYGRCETPQPVSSQDTPAKSEISLKYLGWLVGTPPDGTKCWARFGSEEIKEFSMLVTYDAAHDSWFVGDKFDSKNTVDLICLGWWPLPEDDALSIPGDLTPQEPPQSKTDPAPRKWQTGTPTKEGSYWVEVQCGRETKRQSARWTEDLGWKFYIIDATFSAPVLRWYPLPEED